MIRFVISPDREVVFDANEKLPGSGIWMYPLESSFDLAVQKRIFYKAAKGTVKIPENLKEIVISLLRERVLKLIGFSRKSGALVFGYEGVKKAIEAGLVCLAFESDDSSENGRNKLYRATDEFLICDFFTREELGEITGQESQVHVAVTDKKIADVLMQTIKKISLLKGIEVKG
ncbi:MAG: DUF448 domain-containing protein [Alphaproteobacteria bacterium]|nr:DUF448 domain-containing protein [Alphaproteobacteria bacterium]